MKNNKRQYPVQADLQSADLEYQHLQCEKKDLRNCVKTNIFSAETTV